MHTTSTVRVWGAPAACLLVCSALALVAGAGEPAAEDHPPEVQSVSFTLEQFVQAVLQNHLDLELPTLGADARRTTTRRTGGGIVVRPAERLGRLDEFNFRETVNRVLFGAIEAYWRQVLRVGKAEILERAAARAEQDARLARVRAGAAGGPLPAAMAETFLQERRFALHRARQDMLTGEDRLKLALNDEMIRVDSDTRLLLRTEAPERFGGEDFDVTDGVRTAEEYRLAPDVARVAQVEARTDKVTRRRVEEMALEVKSAWRQVTDARTRLGLSRKYVAAAEDALEAADEKAEEAGGRITAEFLLVKHRADEALTRAETELLAAEVEYQIALAAWYRATGELHEKWNVELSLRD